MTMIASLTCRVTGGVDTHGDVHVAAVLDSATGRLLGTESFDTTTAGYASLAGWLAGHGTVGQVGVESTGSYGAGLSQYLVAEGFDVIEVDRADRKSRHFNGKTDTIDAEAAARAVLAGIATAIPKTHDGHVEAVRVLEVVHHSAVKDRTRAINQFHALIVTAPDQLRNRFRGQSLLNQLARARRLADHSDIVEGAVRLALRELAKRISDLDSQLARLEQRLRTLIAEHAPALIGVHGVGPMVAAQLLAAVGDNPGRLRSEAAFAKLAGVCPLPASSGKTQRLRLNRGGDRRANNALHTIVLVRMRHHAPTRAYVQRRLTEADPKTRPEIMRCLKRYVAREIYQVITNPTEVPTGTELRQMRTDCALSLTTVCNAVGTTPTGLSRLERGLTHDTRLAHATHQWLTQQTP